MEFYDLIKDLLEKREFQQCSDEFYSVMNIQNLEESSWDVASLFCEYLSKSDAHTDHELIEFSHKASLYLCELFGNAKELFLIYLESGEEFFSTDQKFLILVDILQVLLLRLSAKLVHYSLEMALNQFNKHMKKISPPASTSQLDDSWDSFNKVTTRYIEFLTLFVEKELNEPDTMNLKPMLTHTLLNLLNEPFNKISLDNENLTFTTKINFDLKQNNSMKQIFYLINKLNKNLLTLIMELENLPGDESSIKPDKTAISVLLYLMLTKDFELTSCLPTVYDSFYLMNILYPILSRLFSPTSQSLVSKGLCALNCLLSRVDDFSLRDEVLELNAVTNYIQLLFRVCVYSESEANRKNGVQSLKLYFSKLDRNGRFWFINYFLLCNEQDETMNNFISSYLIYLFKEEVNDSLNSGEDFYAENKFNFKRLFNLSTRMKKGSDLVRESSRVIAALNMLRFLLLKDKEDKTGVYKLVKNAEFLGDLKKIISDTKSSYRFEAKNVKEKPESSQEQQFEVTTNENEKIKEPNVEEKLKSIDSAIQTLDLIESLRARCKELYFENL